ncbi:MAG: hypothetical protein FD145_1033 [Candidatus Saganbacteria bacterium]|uniref:Uncharacterized protein n=1 Tax=Candidatus Saganbacteria bacterium TaxID=2575572 RepID=A0A833L0L0_UNCSA|nr:MAG: hypothetical protein FD145_1033 [Candidatus Saganbacteria bacterium]
MKVKIVVFFLVFIIAIQSVGLAFGSGLSSWGDMSGVGVLLVFGLILDAIAYPWLIDSSMGDNGSKSNYWGTFWGALIPSWLYLAYPGNIGFFIPTLPGYYFPYLGIKIIGGYLGHEYLLVPNDKSLNNVNNSLSSAEAIPSNSENIE